MLFWEQSCLWAVKHDFAAMTTGSKTNPPPICFSFSGFGKNAFHRAIDKQNSRWASTTQPPSHLSKDFSLQAFYQSWTRLPLLFVLSPAIAVNYWTGDYSPICITLCSDTRVRATNIGYGCVFAVAPSEWKSKGNVCESLNTHER